MAYTLPEAALPFTLTFTDDEYRDGILLGGEEGNEVANAGAAYELSKVPLVLLHGWPGSFLEFLPMLELAREKYTQETLPFHIIVPSLPGYTLSSPPPQDSAWEAEDAARIIHTALGMLNFHRYAVQGGDVGCLIASILADQYSNAVGVHLNLLPWLEQVDAQDPRLSEWESAAIRDNVARFAAPTLGAAIMNSTRPATIAAILSSNPMAYLAWMGEKYLEWPEKPFDANKILTAVTLYWLTATLPRCEYTYRHTFMCGKTPSFSFIDKPFGYSWFKKELMSAPKKLVKDKGRLVFYRHHEHGGHFAAWECPQEFFADMEIFMEALLREL